MSDLTDKWLKENDPLYFLSDKQYKTARQMRRINQEKEIPASCLTSNEVRQLMDYPYKDNTIRRLFSR